MGWGEKSLCPTHKSLFSWEDVEELGDPEKN